MEGLGDGAWSRTPLVDVAGLPEQTGRRNCEWRNALLGLHTLNYFAPTFPAFYSLFSPPFTGSNRFKHFRRPKWHRASVTGAGTQPAETAIAARDIDLNPPADFGATVPSRQRQTTTAVPETTRAPSLKHDFFKTAEGDCKTVGFYSESLRRKCGSVC